MPSHTLHPCVPCHRAAARLGVPSSPQAPAPLQPRQQPGLPQPRISLLHRHPQLQLLLLANAQRLALRGSKRWGTERQPTTESFAEPPNIPIPPFSTA